MTTQIEVAELGPKGQALVDDLAENGGEICLTRDGKTVAKLVRVDNALEAPTAELPRSDDKVFYNGRWMIPAAAERERSIEHLRGSVKILGDIVSPIDDVEWDALK
jgi:antitoxin (DNA-binding transcriptional repressor) of toxin-antitoxin stability system